MSMSTHVVGFRPADAKWKAMKAIWDACNEADVAVPAEVDRFFNGESPGDKPGAEVKIEGTAAIEWRDDYRQGFELDVTKLPKDVHIVRFYNSY